MILTQFCSAGATVFTPACGFCYKHKDVSNFSTTEVKIFLIGALKREIFKFSFLVSHSSCATRLSLQSLSALKMSVAASCCVLEAAS